jgi:hypothetical protein
VKASRLRRCDCCGKTCRPRPHSPRTRCFACAHGQCRVCRHQYRSTAEGPHELDPPRIHEYHRLAMLGLPLFTTKRKDR